MSYIPAALRRTGYTVATRPTRVSSPAPSGFDAARQAYLRELQLLALAEPETAILEAAGTHSATSQILLLAHTEDARMFAAAET